MGSMRSNIGIWFGAMTSALVCAVFGMGIVRAILSGVWRRASLGDVIGFLFELLVFVMFLVVGTTYVNHIWHRYRGDEAGGDELRN